MNEYIVTDAPPNVCFISGVIFLREILTKSLKSSKVTGEVEKEIYGMWILLDILIIIIVKKSNNTLDKYLNISLKSATILTNV